MNRLVSVLALVLLIAITWVFFVFASARVRARRVSDKNLCTNNLRMIEAAKEQYARERHVTNGSSIVWTDLSPYVKNHALPTCRSSQSPVYSLGRVGSPARCSVHGDLAHHHFPEHVPLILKVCRRGPYPGYTVYHPDEENR